jgi:hypothetical protein
MRLGARCQSKTPVPNTFAARTVGAGTVTDVIEECLCTGSSCRQSHCFGGGMYKDKKRGFLSNQIVIKRKGVFLCCERILLNCRLVIIT